MKVYLAADIGASSGRLIAGWFEDALLKIKEIHRFKNGFCVKDDHLIWDTDNLYEEIVKGLQKTAAEGLQPVSLGIDTWGVDYALLDKDLNLVEPPYAYRDKRTAAVVPKLYEIIGDHELYKRNGIQKLSFNTIYQLYEQKLNRPAALDKAVHFLMIPDFLTFKLTGMICNEYTNGTTTQLVNPATHDWDHELLDMLGLPQRIFKPLTRPGSVCAPLLPDLTKKLGFNLEVTVVASHDTASAVAAAPIRGDDDLYLSSGTWSLMGIERETADCSDLSFEYNFTNEGGYDYRYRFLKNIMGLWILQNLRKEMPPMSYEQSYDLAMQGSSCTAVVDVNDEAFLAPSSMRQAFTDYCQAHYLAAPQNDAQLLYCAYNSLSSCYKEVAEQIEKLAGRRFHNLNIIGGGCQDKFLNTLISKSTGLNIYAGPVEGTAIGNLCVQMIRRGDIADLKAARELIRASFDIRKISDD